MVTGTAIDPVRPAAASRSDEQEQRAIDGHLLTQLVDEEQALGAAIEDDAEISSDGRDELPGSIHRGLRADVGREEAVDRDRLDSERAEHERQGVRGRRIADVDRNPDAAREHGTGVERVQHILRVALAHARRIGRVADLGK